MKKLSEGNSPLNFLALTLQRIPALKSYRQMMPEALKYYKPMGK